MAGDFLSVQEDLIHRTTTLTKHPTTQSLIPPRRLFLLQCLRPTFREGSRRGSGPAFRRPGTCHFNHLCWMLLCKAWTELIPRATLKRVLSALAKPSQTKESSRLRNNSSVYSTDSSNICSFCNSQIPYPSTPLSTRLFHSCLQ